MGEIDISWESLRRIARDWAGTSAELSEIAPLVGGCVNTTLKLQLNDGTRAVLKISPYRVDRSYEREAAQLVLMKSLGLPVPEVYRWKIGSLDDPVSYLLIEFVEGVDLHKVKKTAAPEEYARVQSELGDLVAAMHANTHPTYMRVMEGAEALADWCAFYRVVYQEIWAEARKHPLLPKSAKKQIDKVHDKLEKNLAHPDCPRLVHWDIWSANILAKSDPAGQWRISALLDPNCKYAHAEAEIAYMELFHTITPAFMESYQKRFKLAPEYHQVRKHIYQLYPLINHLRLFGAEYVKPLAEAAERTAACVR